MRVCKILYLALVTGVALGACTAGDLHEEATHVHHHVRDLATEPCDTSNWSVLVPDLRECTLTTAVLAGESLRRVDLSSARLIEVNLERADLFKAVLTAANLAQANLAGAKLTNASLSGADLTGASLSGAVLINATLTGAKLDGATTDATTTCPAGNPGPCW
jgi:uncharacterized protein YjbI with pentapeptide repeats